MALRKIKPRASENRTQTRRAEAEIFKWMNDYERKKKHFGLQTLRWSRNFFSDALIKPLIPTWSWKWTRSCWAAILKSMVQWTYNSTRPHAAGSLQFMLGTNESTNQWHMNAAINLNKNWSTCSMMIQIIGNYCLGYTIKKRGFFFLFFF